MRESIKHAVVKSVDGFICMGKSHADCFYQGRNLGLEMSGKASDQGFITSKGRYVERPEAGKIAKRADQLPKDHNGKILLSEDIWYQERIVYCSIKGYCTINVTVVTSQKDKI